MILFVSLLDPQSTPARKALQLDETLIARIGKDDHAAFKIFYDTINETLYAYLLTLTQNHHDAEDLLQEVYLRVRASAHLYKPQGKPMAWVFTIARNLARMHHRSGQRIQDVQPEDAQFNLAAPGTMDAHDRLVLQTLLSDLEERQRSIILLHAVAGFKLVEIAKNLEMPISTVLSSYNRGLRKLRQHLQLKGVLS